MTEEYSRFLLANKYENIAVTAHVEFLYLKFLVKGSHLFNVNSQW